MVGRYIESAQRDMPLILDVDDGPLVIRGARGGATRRDRDERIRSWRGDRVFGWMAAPGYRLDAHRSDERCLKDLGFKLVFPLTSNDWDSG
ncbi:MAG TPA: hypothetical protein VMT88_14170 [Actinomycetes bacterium]|nr:hypothetical protein [Actinomycetes bacterium]